MDQSRIGVAAITCVIACGVLLGGAGCAVAIADEVNGGGSDRTGSHDNGGDNKSGNDPDASKGDNEGPPGSSTDPTKHDDPQTDPTDPPTDTPSEDSEPTNTTTPTTTETTTTTTTTTTETTTTTTTETTPEPPCDGNDDGCVGQPPGGGGGGGGQPPLDGGGLPGLPGEPGTAPVVDAQGATPAAGAEPAPISLSPLISAPELVPIPFRPPPVPNGRPGAGAPSASNAVPAADPLAGRERLPASAGSRVSPPESFRLGYPDYLRSARMGEVALLALSGVAGILALTAAGGLVGYRQARAGLMVRTAGTARFLQ